MPQNELNLNIFRTRALQCVRRDKNGFCIVASFFLIRHIGKNR